MLTKIDEMEDLASELRIKILEEKAKTATVQVDLDKAIRNRDEAAEETERLRADISKLESFTLKFRMEEQRLK